jgi:hypothetical protein
MPATDRPQLHDWPISIAGMARSLYDENHSDIECKIKLGCKRFIGRPSAPEDWVIQSLFVDWPPPYSPMPWSIRGLEPAYTRVAGACAGSGTDG